MALHPPASPSVPVRLHSSGCCRRRWRLVLLSRRLSRRTCPQLSCGPRMPPLPPWYLSSTRLCSSWTRMPARPQTAKGPLPLTRTARPTRRGTYALPLLPRGTERPALPRLSPATPCEFFVRTWSMSRRMSSASSLSREAARRASVALVTATAAAPCRTRQQPMHCTTRYTPSCGRCSLV